MKLAVIAAAAALVLAGAALAQSQPTDHGTSGGAVSAPSDFEGRAYSPPYVTTQQQAAVAAYRQSVQAYKLACAVDQRSLCQGRRTDGDVWACIRIHRSKVTEPCRQATYAVERARQFPNG